MNKALLMSINPYQCLNIANNKQSIIPTKIKPKLTFPFKVYIYCTNGKPILGRCLLDNSLKETPETDFDNYNRDTLFRANGKVIGDFVCDTIITDKTFGHDALFNEAACMTDAETASYCINNETYGLHISHLKIYDRPKALCELHTVDKDAVRRCGHRHQSYCSAMCNSGYIKNGFYCDRTADWCTQCTTKPITKAPSFWCYVEELR